MANVVEIILKGTDKLSAPFQNAFRSAKDFEKAMVAVGTVAAGAIAAAAGSLATLTLSAINTADEMGKMAQRIGIPVEALSRLSFAAKLADLSNQQLETGLKQLAKTMSEAAANPATDAGRAFEAMGIQVKNADGTLRSMEDTLLLIADRFSTYRDSAEKTALAQELFGRSGTDMIPLLNQGSEAIRSIGQEANVVTDSMARQADAFKDNIDRLKTAIAALGFNIANNLLPYLVQFTFHLADNVRITIQYLERSQVLANAIKAIGSAYLLASAGAQAFFSVFSGEKQETITQMLQEIREETRKTWDELWSGKLFKDILPPLEAPTSTAPSFKEDPEVLAGQKRYDALLEAAQQWQQEDRKIWENAVRARIQAEERGKQAIISTTGQMFGTMARLAATFGSKNFALQQAFQIGQAIMNTSLGITRALAEHTWPYSVVIAGIIAAMGAAEIAIIAAAKPGGQAHAGLDFVNREGTFLLSRGERVIQPAANQALIEFLDRERDGTGRMVQVSIFLDGDILARALGQMSRDGRLTIDARAVT